MKVVILAGGFGSRISEYTKTIPKPLIKIAGKPIIFHIMKHYSNHGYKSFIIAGGYKCHLLKNYFKKKILDWNVQVVNTGTRTMTGGRLKRLNRLINKENFLMTYGDGVSNININKLVKFHIRNKKLATLSAVRPLSRFGVVKIKGNLVEQFKEKAKLNQGWINGGFFVLNSNFLKLIKNDQTYLEKEPLEIACKKKQLVAFKHTGFWHCMDTKRDKINLEKLFKNKKLNKSER